jgi:SH3-like domain-containing protein
MIRPHRAAPALFAAALLLSFPRADSAAQSQDARRGTGLPLPRFVSLKSDNVNVRRGPGQEYDVAFTYVRRGLPVEITQEFDNWRKIRDSDGAEGWVFHSLLSGERTALVAPWEQEGQFAAHASASESAPIVAYLEPRVIAEVEECTSEWCLISVQGHEGWVEQERLRLSGRAGRGLSRRPAVGRPPAPRGAPPGGETRRASSAFSRPAACVRYCNHP